MLEEVLDFDHNICRRFRELAWLFLDRLDNNFFLFRILTRFFILFLSCFSSFLILIGFTVFL